MALIQSIISRKPSFVQLLFDEGIISCLGDVEITEITEIFYPRITLGEHGFFTVAQKSRNLKIILNENLFCVIRVLRGLLLDDDAEGGAVMGFGGFDEEAFFATTKLESMV